LGGATCKFSFPFWGAKKKTSRQVEIRRVQYKDIRLGLSTGKQGKMAQLKASRGKRQRKTKKEEGRRVGSLFNWKSAAGEVAKRTRLLKAGQTNEQGTQGRSDLVVAKDRGEETGKTGVGEDPQSYQKTRRGLH